MCSVDINKPDMTYAFHNLGIQCVRRKDAPASLEKREKIKVDPFKQGFKHKTGPIDLNCVKLCFQVFLKVPQPGSNNPRLVPVQPVVSNVVKDKKAYSDVSVR